MKQAKTKKITHTLKSVPYLLPAIISIIIFSILPILNTIYLAFTDYTMYSQGKINFVGIANFKEVFAGPFKEVFFPVFIWTCVFATLATAGTFLLGLIMAILVNNENIKERGLYKAILIIPWALPATVAILSWQGLLNGSYGAINNLLISVHAISAPIPWLTNPLWARIAIIIVTIWLGFPYAMNICLGSLQSIPKTYYEAADVDGASKFVKFIKITLPSLAQTAYPLVISSFAFNFNNFGQAYLITNGNPARPGTQFAGFTDILASVNYKLSITFGRYEIASTISIIIFIILATISYIQMKASGQFEEVD
ncbi:MULTISPECIES: carbohydrate ABC transporter permease [Clostridium]|uniref:Maltose/maltodextrin transport system permease protein n=1 Tax=Clostridium saccharoperbutylacetonicum N1-4(HMT) TaxID=931276 RepID=M1N686_9CLOT|nr:MULTISPECIES: sugar ABC transporter permease [Clostridium]AGF58922.1 carbohydrate ABC transporter membrane protein 1, CUT1 family [Clostridium saccharoperbutylacetonicum N1-4(HMT)]AQR97593.1 maltose transport system permease protein MalF [Clostridium saccharoperbutylacetonicum]NRT60292.1 arabinogalactan oligomer/maltooligosaccharide transport system permease protein [Clostridium saccharoperbutylacetonicum]NSB23604.1 arabinogalactan oligomer/maltooligosaccharide transport system permease prot